jgi:5-methyltetrahydrofolate--homocysteine methyltransferase
VTSLPVTAQPNAGLPKLIELKVIYDEQPEDLVQGVIPLLEAGTNIVGASCGSTPDHIRAFRAAIDQYLQQFGRPAEASA